MSVSAACVASGLITNGSAGVSQYQQQLGKSVPLAPPLFQSSVYSLPDLDALDAILDAGEAGFVYARDSHPNARLLAQQMANLEAAEWSVVCGSGMAAITASLLAIVGPGERIVASNRLYGRTTQLLGTELARYGVETQFVDSNDLDDVRGALTANARVLFVETISNPLLRVADLHALVELAREHRCHLVVDNTFATPILCRPLELGADLVLESLTKFIGGHSDLTLGVVCGRSGLHQRLAQVVTTWGLAANPFDCWLATRSLPTLALRVRAACANAMALADWLTNLPGIGRVIYPGRSDHQDMEIARRVLDGGFGHMLGFELRGGREAANRFFRLAKDAPLSPSLGHTSTTSSHPACTSHRFLGSDEKAKLGITDGLIRLSVGIDDLPKIKASIKGAIG